LQEHANQISFFCHTVLIQAKLLTFSDAFSAYFCLPSNTADAINKLFCPLID